MWQKIGNVILRNRLFILAIIAILTVFFGYFAVTGSKIDNKYGNTLPKDSPTQIEYQQFKEQFGEDGSTLVIGIDNKSLYSKENFKKWKELGDSILKIDGVNGVISEATLFTIHNVKAESRFEVKRIFSDTTFTEKSIDSIRSEIKNNPLYNGLLYNDSANVSLMMISLDERFLSDQKKSDFVLRIEKLASTYEPYFGHMHFAGLPHIRIVVGKRIVNEMFVFVGLSIFASSLLIFIFFRSFRIVAICNTVVFVSVIWAMGSIGLFGFQISIMMALIPPLMIVIGVPNCVYLVTKYHQEVVIHGNKIRALSRMIHKIGGAAFLTNLTTAIGFCSFTSSEKLAEFGIISALNIMVVFGLSLCLIPIILSYSKPPKPRHLRHLGRVYSQGIVEVIVHLVTRYRTWIYIGSTALVVISMFGFARIKATGNLTGDLPPDDQILIDLNYIQSSFGGAIPFEIMINYKQPGRLFKQETLLKVEEIQRKYTADTLFSKSISIVDFIKVVNMSYYDNDPERYEIISNRDKLRLKKYIDNFDLSNANGGNLSIKELVDTAHTTLRIRTQMKDLGSYEVAHKVDSMKVKIDHILNPEKPEIERLFAKIEKGNKNYIDTLLNEHPAVFNGLTAIYSNGNSDLQYEFDSNPEKINAYFTKKDFNSKLRQAIDNEYYDVILTGTSVVASQGTQYLFSSLIMSLIVATLSITAVMAVLFRAWKVVVISMIPNVIPLIVTAGIMGWFNIPLKPSTLLVFGIALGITVNNAILFLAKYRQEIQKNTWDLKKAIIVSLRETGLSIFYTSIILFFGFIMFVFSQFGGTKALGLLVSITILIGMVTNLLLLPALLLSLEKIATTKSFKEPYFEIYDEEGDIELDDLRVDKQENNN
ncbi:MAG: MMPL family transporter [Crocinitomicaceae bacterium]|nr:MMPL family transporter [Crocinitomicaceae bacterium]